MEWELVLRVVYAYNAIACSTELIRYIDCNNLANIRMSEDKFPYETDL